MNIELNDEHLMLRDKVWDFVKREMKLIANKIDEQEEILRELINKLAEIGFLGAAFPEEYGGGGFGEIGYCPAQEEIISGCGSTACIVTHISFRTGAIFISSSDA